MRKTQVMINVFPTNVDLRRIQFYEESLYGKTFSTLNEICVNKVSNGYSILYTNELFENLDTSAFADNLINILTNNLPDIIIEIEIYYWYLEDYFSTDCGIAIIHLDDYLTDYENSRIQYYTSKSVEYLLENYDEDSGEFDFEDDEEDEDLEEPSFNNNDPFSFLYEDEDEDNSYSKKKNKKKHYDSSKILKASKNPKKNIQRHGLIISDNKSAIKKDEKMIMSFLKEFIPGNSKWIREYRAGILERWMDMYMITKKVLRRLQKEQRKKYKKKYGNGKITKEKAMNFTKKLFTGYDSWNDPNK